MNKLFKFALAALPIVMLASCAKDDLGTEAAKAEKSETRYLKVTLSSPSASPVSRAWSDDNTSGEGGTTVVGDKGYYADGTEDENKIRTLEFYFYDGAKQFHSYVPMTISTPPVTPTENPRPDDAPNISSFYHCNVPITLTQGQTLPTYVVCIVNSVEGTAYQGSTMENAQSKILKDIYGAEQDKGKFFGMSNSVYYGEDPVTGNSGVLIMAAPFTTDKLLTESELAELEKQASEGGEHQNDIEKFTINIPVERYAAKVNLDLTSLASAANIPDYPAGASGNVTLNTEGQKEYTPIPLKFTPKKWGVNATERTFYFLKSFRRPGAPGEPSDEFALQADLNTILFGGWNNAAHKRCFWARTPGYYRDNYPLTSDDITDNMEVDENGKYVYPKDEHNNPIYTYDLQYKTWNECEDVSSLADAYAEYVKETTMKVSRLTGEGLPDQYLPTASLPSVILLGQYKVGSASEGTDFYLYGKAGGGTPIVYSNSEEPIEGTMDIKKQMFIDQTIILQKEGDKYTNVSSGSITEDAAFVIQHPTEEVRNYAARTNAITGGTLHIAADIVVLQLKQAPASTLYFFNPAEGKYQAIDASNLDYVNLLLYQNLGGAHYYKDGMAYFSAPIQHWGWYRTAEDNKENGLGKNENYGKPMDEWDWSVMKTGDFGIVRNHVYTMKIGSITGLGTGIANPDVPIVPPADKVKYAVHFHVNIQRWAVLPTQEWNW